MQNVSQYKYLYAILTEPFLSGSVKVLLWQMVPQNFTSVAGLEVNLPAMTHTLGVTAVLVIMTSPLLSDLVHYFLISLFVILFLPCHSWFKVLLIRLASLLAKMLLSPSVRWILSLQAVLSPQRGCLDHRNCSPTADTSCANSC